MLELPMLKVSPDEKTKGHIMEAVRVWLEREERAPGIHASDLLDPLYAYMRMTHGQKLKDRDLNIFMAGHVLHAFVISAVDGKQGVDFASDQGSRFSKELGISYSVDLFRKGVPREIKTSRSFFPPLGKEDIRQYLEQVLIYMAAENSLVGQIWALYLNIKDSQGRTAPEIFVYTVRVTQKELDKFKRQVVTTRKLLETARKKKDPSKLPLCREWKCGEKYCPYFTKQCKPEGRYGLPKKEWKR